MSPTVLVTGASGFIGRRLVDALLQTGARVRAVTRDRVRVAELWSADRVQAVSADLGDQAASNGLCAGVDTVFHLAGGEADTPAGRDQALQTGTVIGTRALLADAVTLGVKHFVFMSSVKAMGEGGAGRLNEDSPAQPVSLYGHAKLIAETQVFDTGKRHGLHVCALRLPMVYGGNDRKGNLPRMIAAVDRGRFPPLPNVNNKRSMVHVDDVVRAARLASDHPSAAGKTYIVTDGYDYSTYEIYQAVRAALGKPPARWSVPLSGWRAAAYLGDRLGRGFPLNSVVLMKLIGSAWYSSEKIQRELGYRPTHTLFEALPKMIAHYRRQGT